MSDDDHQFDGLDDADRQIRIERLIRELESIGDLPLDEVEKMPIDVAEAFLENVRFFENAPRTSFAKLLISDGLSLPPSKNLTDAELHAKLWEVIRGLSLRQVFLYNTDHVDDRGLYDLLWFDLLNGDTVDISDQPDSAYHLDVLGSGSEQDIKTYLKYYANEDERREWSHELAADEIPEPALPPHDRDRFLPKRVGE
tara:strand:- start:97 stop:690 length:594 start_codon:yes stop_codon:yes gene_type:complete